MMLTEKVWTLEAENETMEATNLHEESNSVVSNIPQEIITDILSRLPVKSLLKLRCVCKSWLSLISSSQFINTHLNLSSNYSLILASDSYLRKFFTCSISSILANSSGSINPMNLDFPFQEPVDIRVVGACNGLLCLSVLKETIILCNPTTKKFKKVTVEVDGTVKTLSFGFCHDKLNDDYKVVELFASFSNGGGIIGYQTKAKVYSVKCNNWREIEGVAFQGGRVSVAAGVCVSGILHWSTLPSLNDSRLILSLNMVTYVFGVIQLPEYDETDDADDVDWVLGEFGGRLGVICDYDLVRVDVWVMKEYGVKESWIKLMSIPYPENPYSYIFPIFEVGNGEVIFNYDPYVMLYNLNNTSLRKREVCSSLGKALLVMSPPYVESLVSPCLDG